MNSVVLCFPQREELAAVMAAMTFLLRQRGWEARPLCLSQQSMLQEYLGEKQLGVLVCDVTTKGMLALLEQLRKANPDMKLVLLADTTISPVTYIRPSILPMALLWRPVDQKTIQEQLKEVLDKVPEEKSGEIVNEDMLFSIEVRGIVRRFSYQDILYFEARDKRLYLHLQRKEVPFTGTLEHLSTVLPDAFMRVHKSLIVNRLKITEIQFGRNELTLEDGSVIPISRSYKQKLKAVFS